MAILTRNLEVDPDLTTYFNELVRMNKPENQNNTFWFPTPKNIGNTEDHTPKQTNIRGKLQELKGKRKSQTTRRHSFPN